MVRRQRCVVDASAVGRETLPMNCVTTQYVAEEIKSKQCLSIRVLSISENEIKQVLKRVTSYPEHCMLSRADLSLLALLFRDSSAVLLTRDFTLQNVAKKLGLQTQAELHITKVRTCPSQCSICRWKWTNRNSTSECPRCGSK